MGQECTCFAKLQHTNHTRNLPPKEHYENDCMRFSKLETHNDIIVCAQHSHSFVVVISIPINSIKFQIFLWLNIRYIYELLEYGTKLSFFYLAKEEFLELSLPVPANTSSPPVNKRAIQQPSSLEIFRSIIFAHLSVPYFNNESLVALSSLIVSPSIPSIWSMSTICPFSK